MTDTTSGNTPGEHEDLPLTLADLERVRADLRDSIRHTEAMLARTEALLMATALLSHAKSLDLLAEEDRSARLHAMSPKRFEAPYGSTN
jgi:hypothetical protein